MAYSHKRSSNLITDKMFDPEKKAEGLDSSTFDIVQIEAFHNTNFWTILSFLWVWMLLLFKLAILGGDTYTCLNILVFNRWSTSEYDVYAYKVAKWIFTGCIFFRFLLLAYQIAWAIHIYRTRNIALAYLNNYARMMYALRSYDYQCLFHEIDQEGFLEWACFYVYTELDDALEIVVADLPRQVINFMTLRYYATGGELNNDILANIKAIATTNLRLSIILSFQLCTMVLFFFFFLKFLLAIILYIPIKVKVANKGFRSLKAFCYKSVNEKVRSLVRRNHKPRAQILEEGVLELKDIRENPLLNTSTDSNISAWSGPGYSRDYGVRPLDAMSVTSFNMYDRRINSSDNLSKESLLHPLNSTSLQQTRSSLNENPFLENDNESRSHQNSFQKTSDKNPFSDPITHFSGYPHTIRPPTRSQTSDSLLNRRAAENSAIFGSDYPNPSQNWLPNRIDSLGGDDGRSAISNMKEYSSGSSSKSHTHVSSKSSSQRSSGETSRHQSIDETTTENQISSGGIPPGPSTPILTGDTQTSSEVPYPVRGVSKFFEDNSEI